MSHGKQFTLYSQLGPNGWKVAHILEELNLTYETVFLNFKENEQKGSEFTKLNPNGRIPVLVDHYNNDFVIWESGAILIYIAEKYDKERRIYSSDENEKHLINQWLFFQASGQGPYFGQLYHFAKYHHEKIPSAIERYKNEILRVFGVLDRVLAKQPWLVGNKFTIADLSFVIWNDAAAPVVKDYAENYDFEKDYPALAAWHAKLVALPSVQKVLQHRAAKLREQK